MGMRLRSLLLPTLAAVVVAVVGLAFAPSRPSAPASPSASAKAGATAVVSGKAASLKIVNYAFVPATMTVRVGTTITVTNADQTAHTATARSAAFDSGTVDGGKSKSFTVTKPGVYPYYCQFHAFMNGTLKVVR